MSGGQRARTPDNFPRMKVRGTRRREHYDAAEQLGTVPGRPWITVAVAFEGLSIALASLKDSFRPIA